jgi:hypothetical protein
VEAVSEQSAAEADGEIKSGVMKSRLLIAWRVALLALLVWIGLELRWARQEMPTLPWDFDSQVSDIQTSLDRIVEKLGL